jgi:hypothetical protein
MSNVGRKRRQARRDAKRATRNDDNRWIVSRHSFLEHRSPRLAELERARLAAKHPDDRFRLYRIKRVLVKPEHRARPQRLFARLIYAMLARVDRWR